MSSRGFYARLVRPPPPQFAGFEALGYTASGQCGGEIRPREKRERKRP
jgi:hypothetical protein